LTGSKFLKNWRGQGRLIETQDVERLNIT